VTEAVSATAAAARSCCALLSASAPESSQPLWKVDVAVTIAMTSFIS
jgi:hypothetical protein